MSSPSPKSPEQSEKSKKYDRQLRLWGDHGQKLVENAKICLVNATALGTEILKSLVLPGIGSFTIVDGEKITDEDLGSNFFLDNDSLGLSRAQVATQNLLELNSDVRGDYIDESVDHVMTHSQDFFDTFSVVIATALPEKTLMPLSKHLWERNVPLIVCRSVGFLGYIRLQVKEHPVVESHPDNENLDLRLDKPWPALEEFLSKFTIPELDSKERSHVPAVVILYYYLKKYKSLHNGNMPSTRAEKDEIKKMIQDSAPADEHGIKHIEENFKEAIKYINTCVNPARIPEHVKKILDDSCTNIQQNSSPFWVLCAALREFVECEGALPVRGTLPDMAADTTSYVNLQHIYQKQAQVQSEVVYRRALQISRNLGLNQDAITETEAKLLCKHSSELNVIRGSCIALEYEKSQLDLNSYLEDPDSLMFHYITLRGLERFISEFNTCPGQLDDHVEPDVLKLKCIIGKLLSEWGCAQIIIREERVHEVCRYGGAELHSVSAILGGCAAHEAIKLITCQYKPLNNTFIYDAITSTSASFTL